MYAVDRSTSLGWTSWLVISLLVTAAFFMAAFVFSQLNRRRLATWLLFPLLLIAVIAGLRGGIVEGWTSLAALVMFGAALTALVSIPIGARGSPEPLLHLELFRDGTFSWAMVLSFLVVTALFGGMLLLPLYLQQVHGFDALETGLLLLPQAGVAAITMPIGGMLTDRIGPRPVVITGLLMLTIGGVVLAQIHPDSSIMLVIIANGLRGFGMGFAMMPSMSAALARIDPRFTSRASSITNSLQRVSSSIGIAVLVTILAAQFTTAAQQTACTPSQAVLSTASVREHHAVTQVEFCGQLRASFSNLQVQGGGSTSAQARPPFIKAFGDDVLSTSFDRTFAFIAIITLIGVIPAFFLKKPDKKRSVAVAA